MGQTCKTLYGRLMKGIEMKKISSVISLSFIVLFLLVTPVMGSDDWVEYSHDKDGVKYIVQVWEKKFLSDKNKKKYIQVRRHSGKSTKGWDKLVKPYMED